MNTHGSTNPCRPNLFEEANKKYTINYQHFGISEVSQNGLGRRDRVGGLWVQSRGWENVTPALPLSSWALAMGRQFLTELACLHLQASHHLPLWWAPAQREALVCIKSLLVPWILLKPFFWVLTVQGCTAWVCNDCPAVKTMSFSFIRIGIFWGFITADTERAVLCPDLSLSWMLWLRRSLLSFRCIFPLPYHCDAAPQPKPALALCLSVPSRPWLFFFACVLSSVHLPPPWALITQGDAPGLRNMCRGEGSTCHDRLLLRASFSRPTPLTHAPPLIILYVLC